MAAGDGKKEKKTTSTKPKPKPKASDKSSKGDADGADDFQSNGKGGKENKLDVCHSDPMNIFEDVDKATEGGKKRLSIERIYQKKSQLEHILLRPDTYIGSVEELKQTMWVYDVEGDKMVMKDITFVPGLYKIFDEIIVNAADNKQRDKSMSCIKIKIDAGKNEISVWNNGKGIPVVEHQVEKMFVPEMIFGTLLTSSNYDDSERKVTGGRNGYGAKLCNIFSTKFTVETSCKEYKKSFKQTWTENMQKTEKAEIGPSKDDDFTCITFKPDLSKFKMTKLDDDIVALMYRRAYDLAGTSKGVKVYLNGKKIPVTGFKQYVELYTATRKDENNEALKLVYNEVNPRWEVAVAVSDKGFQNVSFVNSIATTKGGRHVDYVADQIIEKIIDDVKKKVGTKSGINVKPFQIKNHLWLFVNCLIENPTFDSQTKENMTLQSRSFGSKCELPDKFFQQVMKCGVVDSVLLWVKFKQETQLNKQCFAKKHSKVNVEKLEDANEAGGKRGLECTLIVTEGDSAKTLAVSGVGHLGKDARDIYGIYPLRGKVLNVREATHKQIMENKEINALIRALGLQYQKKYVTKDDMKTLRYGRLMIMADQDQDGSHIKGLVINFIHHNWPSLIRHDFIQEFITPIVKVTKGKETLSFFSLPEYEEWKSNTDNWNTWKIKYYKGLGTSTSNEAKEYFKNLLRHRIAFKFQNDNDDKAIELAFSKQKVDQRKEWLTNFMQDRRTRKEAGLPDIYLYEQDTKAVSFHDFINKELVLFSNMDNERSIPCLVDGFKPGQRKVIFTCFKRNDKREVKVAQLAGSVAEMSAYHHGEQSLMGTIINLAQNFVGSNNINLLLPNGQFGTRLNGGKDSASPRYIFTLLNPVTRALFVAADEPCLRHLTDDNKKIEPEWFCPIIPSVLVNGAEGIGSGWATNIPTFNPRELVANVRRMLNHEDPLPMKPFFKGFRGEVEAVGAHRYVVSGEIAELDDGSYEITELPVGTWTTPYKESVLEPLSTVTEKQKKPKIEDFKEYHTDTTVRFVVKMNDDQKREARQVGFHNLFKLQTTISMSSMVLFDAVGCLRRFDNVEDILKEFFQVRMRLYAKRKEYLEGLLQAEASRLSNQARFILEKIQFVLKLENVKKKTIVEQLITRNYDPDPVKKWKEERRKLEAGDEDETAAEDTEDEEAAPKTTATDSRLTDFDYLLSMAMIKMSEEEKDKLLKERDAKIEELAILRGKTSKDLWEEDLTAFETALDKQEEKEREEDEMVLKRPAAGGGKTTAKGKTAPKTENRSKKEEFTGEEAKPSAGAIRIAPSIDENMKQKIDKYEQAKQNKAMGVVSKRGKKKEEKQNAQNGESTADDLESSSLFERISKKRNVTANIKNVKPVSDDKGIARFCSKKKKSSGSEGDASEDESDIEFIPNSQSPPKKLKKSSTNDDDNSPKKMKPGKKMPTTSKAAAPKSTIPKKPKATKSNKVFSESEGDDDVEEFDEVDDSKKSSPPSPITAKRSRNVVSNEDDDSPPKKSKYVFDDDDDDFEVADSPIPTKKTKKKIFDDSDEDDDEYKPESD